MLTGAGDSFSAGMDLREYFRALDDLPYDEQMQRRRSAWNWQWRMLMNYSKPTIAMVNGWCFGGAFTPLVACDLAIAADDAQFGLSPRSTGASCPAATSPAPSCRPCATAMRCTTS